MNSFATSNARDRIGHDTLWYFMGQAAAYARRREEKDKREQRF